MQGTSHAHAGELLRNLAKPTSAYKRRVWLAMSMLLLFMLAYLGLAGWFLNTAYQLTFEGDGSSSHAWLGWLVGLAAAFLAVFMLKGLFFVRSGGKIDGREITAEQQPELFAFLHGLADQLGAPRPHRVFVTAAVNAAVFYDLGPLNLLWPSKKNLEIGLGLVNQLTRSELHAVLAHEFGHFAQRSMAVGRWVYVAQQIAAQLIARRDKLDDFLRGLSASDIRIAWMGWTLGIIVWSIRSLIDTAFRGVLLLQRALSREMEMNADLVAVAVTGSDALINALHKLQAADELWSRALTFASSERAKGRYTRDLFAIQSELLERMGRLYNDPHFGRIPPTVPGQAASERRLFSAAMAQPPRMWLTHPLNHEREANAKRRYIAAPSDERSAWTLFQNPESLREQVSAELLQKPADQAALETADSLIELDRLFGREALASSYRGIYYGRSPVLWSSRLDELVAMPAVGSDLTHALSELYPDELAAVVERRGALTQELAQLRALEQGILKANGQRIDHRGRTLNRRQLPQAIADVESELAAIDQQLQDHDRRCRGLHLAAAKQLGGGWEAYLRGLLAVLHYAEHSEANLRDVQALVATSVSVVTATRKVNEAGLQRVLVDASSMRDAMDCLYSESSELQLDPSLLELLEGKAWTERLGEFSLPYVDRAQLGQWLDAAETWVSHLCTQCSQLSGHALDALLQAERRVAEAVRTGSPLPEAPGTSVVPSRYATMAPGQQRPRSTQLSWQTRFLIADGWLAASARLAAALLIVGSVLSFGSTVGDASLTIYNGLGRPVLVSVAGHEALPVAPHGHLSTSIGQRGKVEVETRTAQGTLIERFDATLQGRFANLVYNVAAAAPLVEWTANYGNAPAVAPRELGAQRWLSSSADVLFEAPPQSISTKGGGGTRRILSGGGDAAPGRQLELVKNESQRRQMIEVRARWDDADWIRLMPASSERQALIAERLREAPHDVQLGRVEQDLAGDQRDAVCARHAQAARAKPESPGLQYLALRCLENGPDRDRELAAARSRFPSDGWIAFLAGYRHAELSHWGEALSAYGLALTALPEMADEIAMIMARLQRISGLEGPYPLQRLMNSSPALQQLLALDSSNPPPGSIQAAYRLLAQGQLDQAIDSAKSDPVHAARLLRLAAASDGASADVVQRALKLDANQGLDANTVWPAIGLATRHGQAIEPLMTPLDFSNKQDQERTLRFLAAIKPPANRALLEALISEMPLELRAGCRVAGLVALGANAPVSWRSLTKRELFSTERPYFH